MALPATPTERAASWLAMWDRQGFHRTATEGDEEGADWLADIATKRGARVVDEDFAIHRIDDQIACIEFEGERIDGEMLFDGPTTPPSGVVGKIGEAIGVLELSPYAVYTPELRTARTATDAGALIIITRGERPGLALLNAEAFRSPYGPPTVQLASEHAERIHAAAARGAEVRVTVTCSRTLAHARNTVVTLRGTDPRRAPLVVMTPRSSWYESTSERGGGLVCWLESLRSLLTDPPESDVVFTANSGHELGHLGLDEFLRRRPGWETDAIWVHFGANIDAIGGRLSVVSARQDLRDRAVAALRQAGRDADDVPPGTKVPFGETRDIHHAGGRYVTLIGTNPMFHLPQDRWPHVVDVDRLARTARGAANLVLSLSR